MMFTSNRQHQNCIKRNAFFCFNNIKNRSQPTDIPFRDKGQIYNTRDFTILHQL